MQILETVYLVYCRVGVAVVPFDAHILHLHTLASEIFVLRIRLCDILRSDETGPGYLILVCDVVRVAR